MEPLFQHASGSIAALDAQTLFLSVGDDLREEDVDPFFEVLSPLVEERRPARMVVDATCLAATTLRLRWQILKRARRLRSRVERTAIYGLPPKLETLLWIVLALVRRRDVRTFLWRHEAEGWVLQGG